MQPRSIVLASLFATLAALTPVASAQQAPIGGIDGGRLGGPSDAGGGGAAIPFDVPPERHDLPVPLSVAFSGGATVGEAGVGWSIPFHYISQNDTFGGQRPRYRDYNTGPGLPSHDRRRTTLSLFGKTTTLVAVDDQHHWRAIVDDQTMEVTQTWWGWELLDGTGLRYRFEKLDAPDGDPVIDSIWFLTEIASGHHAESKVELVYRVVAREVESIVANELYLDAIRYNFHPSGACAKNEIELGYAPATDAPELLAVLVDNGALRVRTEILQTVTVRAHGYACETSPPALARYHLGYARDPDTGMPRLVTVDATGRDGTAEATVARPIARYVYGRSSMKGNAFEQPALVFADNDSFELPEFVAAPGLVQHGVGYLTMTTMADVNGDGLTDLAHEGSWYANVAGHGFLYEQPWLSELPDAPEALGQTQTAGLVHNYAWGNLEDHYEETHVQLIDLNGDGRTDLIDDHGEQYTWRVHLNLPEGWETHAIDITNIVNGLQDSGFRVDLYNGRLPLARSVTGVDARQYFCFELDGSPCPDSGAAIKVDGGQVTRVEWKLEDVNGDGYPDVVANQVPSRMRRQTAWENLCDCGQFSNPEGCSGPLGDDDTAGCSIAAEFDYVVWNATDKRDDPAPQGSNGLQVFYNRAGVRLGPTAPFANATKLAGSGSCSLEEFEEQTDAPLSYEDGIERDGVVTYGDVVGLGSNQYCGFIDMNGDGILDRFAAGAVRYGTGEGYEPGIVIDGFGVHALTRSETDHWTVCEADEASSDGAPYSSRTTTGYVDINGDGLPDLVSPGAVRLNTGAGLGPEMPLVTTDETIPFVLSVSEAKCAGYMLSTTQGLFDMDGDGRPELVVRGNGKLRILSLFETDGLYGAINAGRLREVHDGNGAYQRFVYRNLKTDEGLAIHNLPSPEIALVQTDVARWSGPALTVEPTYFVYGRTKLRFDAAADRWTSPGYERVISVRGLPIAQGAVLGTATITDHFQPQDAVGNHDAFLLAGRPRRTVTLEGTFELDSIDSLLLLFDTSADPRWHSDTAYEYATTKQLLPDYTGVGDDCTSIAQPWEGGSSVGIASDTDWDPPCRATGFAYTSRVTTRRGDAGTGDDYIHSAAAIVAVDGYGRPTTVQHLGDLVKTTDDVCETIEYASSTPTWRTLDARWRVRLRAPTSGGEFSPPVCAPLGAILASRRYRFDDLAEGQVSVGKVTHEIVDRRSATGSLVDSWTDRVYYYDLFGNVERADEETGGGLSRRTEYLGFDPFRLVSGFRTVTADGTSLILPQVTEFDPHTLAVTSTTDVNGVETRRGYDGYGRDTRISWVDPDDGVEYIGATSAYAGETVVAAPPAFADERTMDLVDPLGRSVSRRTWSSKVPLASYDAGATAPGPLETWETSWFDALGRVRYQQRALGADYAGASLVLGEVQRDGLGRTTFEADPYVAGASLPHYGTTYRYDIDGSLACTIRGRGPQISTDTSQLDGRFASCRSQTFDAGKQYVRVFGEVESDPSSPTFGAYDEMVFDGAGVLQQKLRKRATTIHERMELGYNRLGFTTLVSRYGSPAVSWTSTFDSLGRVTTYAEPGSAVRNHVYDRAGQETEQWWMEGTTRRAVKTQYDGLGRVLRTVEANNQVEVAATAIDYLYDESSGEAFHQDTAYATGRLTHAHNASQSQYYGYDAFGRPTFSAWVSADGARAERETRYRADGSVGQITFRVPDTGHADETAGYEYDSAQRLRAVTWQDEVFEDEHELYRATDVDAFGRARQVQYGNGVAETLVYRDADRNELLEWNLVATNGTIERDYFYDAALRATQRNVRSTVGTLRHEISAYTYDAARRLATATISNAVTGTTIASDVYSYDALGNLTSLVDNIGTRDFTIVKDTVDQDRICRVIGQGFPSATSCSFTYDAAGNSLLSPLTAIMSKRTGYDNRARVTSMERLYNGAPAGGRADWAYSPSGEIASFTMVGGNASDNRADVRFGDAVERSRFTVAGVQTDRYERFIPGPDGVLMIKRGSGASATYLYPQGDANGTRAVTNGSGAVVQELDYRPFGDARVSTVSAGSLNYLDYQWNGGDLLKTFGVNRLGPRAYEPRLGRFLQRDPLASARSGSRGNPYAFAWNDPVNNADPTGLDTQVNRDDLSKDDLGAFGSSALAAFVIFMTGSDGFFEADGTPSVGATSVTLGSRTTGFDISISGRGMTVFESGLKTGVVQSEFSAKNWLANPDHSAHEHGSEKYAKRVWEVLGDGIDPVGYLMADYSSSGGWAILWDRDGKKIASWQIPGAANNGSAEQDHVPLTADRIALGVDQWLSGREITVWPDPGSRANNTGGGTGPRSFSAKDRNRGWKESKDGKGVPRCDYCGCKMTRACGRPNTYEADHFVPWAKGGLSKWFNLRAACRDCNRSKGSKSYWEWIAQFAGGKSGGGGGGMGSVSITSEIP
jgi:RHS repeat-associated protein